jgi:hypothetical protein
MKTIFSLLMMALSLFSCSSEDNSAILNSNLLQRVDFYPNSPNEKRWLFNSDGLLYQITKADGTIVQDFTYNSNNLLISSTEYNNSGNITHAFTYNNNGFVTSVDGETVNYDAGINAFYTGVLNDYYRLSKINSDKLLVEGKTVFIDIDETGTNQVLLDEMSVSYSDNNILSYFPGESCVYYTYDSYSNPLRNATLSICRAYSFIVNSRWIDGQFNSINNPISQNYCSEDPESEVYHYNYNVSNLPIEQTHDYYYLGTLENTIVSAKYYYQGDVLP